MLKSFENFRTCIHKVDSKWTVYRSVKDNLYEYCRLHLNTEEPVIPDPEYTNLALTY